MNKELLEKINNTPELLSLLYDIDLLPEQTIGTSKENITWEIATHWPVALRSGDGWTNVRFVEGSDGEWTCSGCDRNWYMEAETPEENEYLHCPGCGKRIVSYTKFGAEDLEETT